MFLSSTIRMYNFMKLLCVVYWDSQNEFNNLTHDNIFANNQIHKKCMFQSSSLRRNCSFSCNLLKNVDMLSEIHSGLQIKCFDLIAKNHPQTLQVVICIYPMKKQRMTFFLTLFRRKL